MPEPLLVNQPTTIFLVGDDKHGLQGPVSLPSITQPPKPQEATVSCSKLKGSSSSMATPLLDCTNKEIASNINKTDSMPDDSLPLGKDISHNGHNCGIQSVKLPKTASTKIWA